ncbi:MAG: hypothetical protein ACT4ON_13310 [Bacteroidota bacterium]
MSITNAKLEIKPYTKKELAAIYGMSPRSFSTWMKPFDAAVGAKVGKYYNIHQVRIIMDKLGLPGTVND